MPLNIELVYRFILKINRQNIILVKPYKLKEIHKKY
jgi:hypothetical protein